MSGIGHNGGPPVEEEENPFGTAGWIKIGRDVRNHHLVGFGKTVKPADPDAGHCHSRGEAWLDLLMECRYSAGTVVNKGTKMEIKPGQLLGAVSWLAARWNWTPKTVRWFLDQLQDDGMIERIAPPSVSEIKQPSDVSLNGVNNGNRNGNHNGKYNGNQPSVLSISKYEIYQFVSQLQRQPKRQPVWQPEGQPNGNQTATERQPNGNTLRREEGKKGRIEEVCESESRVVVPMQPEIPKPAFEGEHMGHGVWVSHDTIRHKGFSISLPAIRIGTLRSGLPEAEIKSRCLAHALQWGAEIDGGKLPREVVPEKIANFLNRTIMNEVSNDAIATVKKSKANDGYMHKTAAGEVKAETPTERVTRLYLENRAAKNAPATGDAK